MGKVVRRIAQALRPHKGLYGALRDLYASVRRMRVFVYRYGYVMDEQHKVAYLVNSKAACSSIKVSMYHSEQDIPDDYSVHSRKDRRLKLKRHFTDPAYFKFSYVRDPFRRLVSCYESKYHGDARKGKAHLDYDQYLFGLMKKDRGFAIFLLWVLLIPQWLADPHFFSQYRLLYRRGKLTVDYVGHVEDMYTTYPAIERKYGYAPLKTYNECQYQDYRTYFTPLLARLTYLKFRKDVKAFGYEASYQDLLTFCKAHK